MGALGAMPALAAEKAHVSASFQVSAQANIFGAGHETPPAPAGGGGGRPPVQQSLPPATGDPRTVSFSDVAGTPFCAGGSSSAGPDGPCFSGSDISSFDGIAGLLSDSSMFLAGVFLDDREPADPAPDRLDFRVAALGQSFASLQPGIGQVFFIGDGLDANGLTQAFNAPPQATRLFLGIADAFNFNGAPGAYGDNSGRYTGTVAAVEGATPAPVLGKTVNADVVEGEVFIKVPQGTSARASQKGTEFIPLTEVRSVPVKSILDTRKGTVALRSARGTGGKTQAGRFAGGVFQVLQSRKRSQKGVTELRMKGSAAAFRRCGSGGAQASLSRRAIRRLRARARGRYRTRSRYSAATVRGTTWLTKDSCAGTLTVVKRGKVAVRDFRRKKTIVVSAGEKYFARAPE
jgi:hypothetical protein